MDRIAAAIIGVGASILWWVNPETSSWLPQCPLHAWTGLYCPGCGSTRALHQLLHGHLLAALRFNGMTILALPFLAVLMISGRWPQMRAAWLVVIVVIAFGIVRNVPWYPFTMLSPD